MRSIRRSLVLYFLALMAVVLGLVGVLIDRVAGRTFVDRERATLQLIDLRCSDQAEEERSRFDAQLNTQARLIANDLQIYYTALGQSQFEHLMNSMKFAPLHSLAVGMSPFPVMVPLWSQVGANTRRFNDPVARLNEAIARIHFSKLHLDNLPSVDEHGSDLIQVSVPSFGSSDRVYRSHLLEGENWIPPVPSGDIARDAEKPPENRELSNGTRVRVVGLRSTMIVRLISPGGRSYFPDGSSGPRPNGPRTEPPPQTRFEMPPPQPRTDSQPSPARFRFAYIHYGRPLAPLDEKIAALEERRDEEKAHEIARTARDRFGLRAWLGLIGSLALIGLFGGGMMLVKRGLRPLDTLSDAVSRVSEKDFRLPVEPRQLSKELLPIHDRLTETLSQLKRAFEHDKQAVADISHELRTPVASLMATLDVTLRKPRTAEEYKQKLEDCRGITKQMAGLVERVMTLASLDAGPAGVNTTEVDGAELARSVATIIRPLAEAHDLKFTVDVAQPVRLNTDADKLREVLLNLLHNAIEYNSPGGSIALSVRNGGKNAVFAVKDTGIGMTADVKDQIFNRFYRADPSRTATGLHAGLGLAIVKECIDRLGGRIRVDSRPGVGSEFTVELPA